LDFTVDGWGDIEPNQPTGLFLRPWSQVVVILLANFHKKI